MFSGWFLLRSDCRWQTWTDTM